MEEIQKAVNIESATVSAKQAENFGELLNKPPKKNKIKTNKYANNAKYLSISEYEMQMDLLFFGQWSSKFVGHPQILGNSCVVSVEVTFLHPTTGNWLTRAGTGAQDIQCGRDGKALPKALEKAVPSAKSMAFKNACKTIGKIFGRDLNRQDEATFVKTADAISNIVNAAPDEN